MGESLATFLLVALTIGLAAPFVPFAARLARRSVHDWKDAVLVVAITCALLYVTFAPASLLGVAAAYLITMVIVSPLLSLGGSNIGQGAIAFCSFGQGCGRSSCSARHAWLPLNSTTGGIGGPADVGHSLALAHARADAAISSTAVTLPFDRARQAGRSFGR